ncbi:MAG: DUF1311 domain-containing protein [Deltaproteobacteria bacterium]|nr:DUF1311 domain-containing protein [Deltaproteobacteria bacterium]MBW2381334.1 DUF1311 domain-containing protein [Deltaproteobacteria bacterium]
MSKRRFLSARRLAFVGLLVALSTIPVETDAELVDWEDMSCGKADAELNRVYKKIRKVYKNDKLFLQKLKVAQRAWIKFRDGHIDSLYPDDTPGYYGSVLGECICNEMTYLTTARVAQLKVWLKGTEEGDMCAGSVKW